MGFARSCSRRRRIDARKRVLFSWRHRFLYGAPLHRADKEQKEKKERRRAVASSLAWPPSLRPSRIRIVLSRDALLWRMFFSSYCRAQIATVLFTKRVPYCATRMEAASCLIWRKLVINLTVRSCVGRVQLFYHLHLNDWAKANCGTLSLFNNVCWCTDRRFCFKIFLGTVRASLPIIPAGNA